MDSFISQFLNPGTYILAVIVYALSFFTRRIVETAWPWLRANKLRDGALSEQVTYRNRRAVWWNEVALYAIPVLWGFCFGFVENEWLFGGANNAAFTRFMWACGTGWLAGFLYMFIKRVLLTKTGVNLGTAVPEHLPGDR